MPKANIFKSSEVFKHLNAEAMKTRAKKEQETKRWTTFLQKPDRPVPKSKAELEHERRQANAYRVVIHKQPKPRCAPNRTPTPPLQIESAAEIEPLIAQLIVENDAPTNVETEDINETIGDTEVPNLEQIENGAQIDETNEQIDATTVADNTIQQTDESIVENSEPTITENNEPTKTEEELLIEKQLADVQKQLMALSTLPLTIQATLDAVTKQLADIMPTMKLQAPNKTGIQPISSDAGKEISDEGRQ